MLVYIDGKMIKDVNYVQITHGRLIDCRDEKDDILYSTPIEEKMIFIHDIGVKPVVNPETEKKIEEFNETAKEYTPKTPNSVF